MTSPVLASSLTAQEVLQQFNLVVLGNASSSSHVDGRSFVGGTLTGGEYAGHSSDTPASAYAGLTVGGGASGVKVNGLGAVVGGNLANSTVNNGPTVVYGNANNDSFNGSGSTYVGGSASGVSFNSGHAYSITGALQTEANAATSTNFGTVLTGLSSQLSHLAGNSTVDISWGTATFNAVAGANGVAVFDLTGVDTQVFAANQFQFNLNGATTVILNTDEKSATIAANFLGGSAQAIGAKTLWNFYNATNLTINSQFGGTVLAPGAAFANNQNIEGDVLVKSLDQHAEIHLQPYTGNVPSVPEPETYALMLAGLGILGATARRRARG